jgi:hypothetical protein
MAKPHKEKKPSAAELDALRAIFVDTLLLSAHGIIIHNVRAKVGELLTILGRPDLAAVTADAGALLVR